MSRIQVREVLVSKNLKNLTVPEGAVHRDMLEKAKTRTQQKLKLKLNIKKLKIKK
jgi:hypothetical protein